MLPSAHRLAAESTIRRLFQKGVGSHSDLLGVKVRGNDTAESRFVFVIGTKVHKRAFRRNRLRRRLRALVNLHLQDIAQGKDIAVIAKPPAIFASTSDLEQSLLSALQKAKLIQKLPPLL